MSDIITNEGVGHTTPFQNKIFPYDKSVVIYTPFYKYQAMLPYVMSLFQTAMVLERLGVKFDYWGQEAGFHVVWGVNESLTKFAESDYTDIIIIDSDESWNAQDVVKLLLSNKHVIGGTYRMKNRWDDYLGIYKRNEDGYIMGEMVSETNAIAEAERIPSGFLKVNKKVLTDYIKTYPEDYFYLNGVKSYKFFFDEIKEHQFTGMDYCFSDKMRALGYKLWIDPTLEISHWGMTEYKGNFDKYLRGLKAIQEVKKLG